MTDPRLNYQTIEFGVTDIHVCSLRDKQQFSDPDGVAERLGISSAIWPIFGVIWPSGRVLANFMFDYNTDGKRVLEVGCGIGLTSLLLNKLGVDISATDHHPEVQRFLKRNSDLNGDKEIPFERVDWAEQSEHLGLFDIIVGSDLLYEDQHIAILAEFIGAHANPQCEVILVDAGRGYFNKLSNKLLAQGYLSDQQKVLSSYCGKEPFKGRIFKFTR